MRERLLSAVSTFTQAITSPFDLDDVLDRLAEQTVGTLDAVGAGIMLEGRDGELAHAASSDDLVAKVERIQEREHTGACYEAFATNTLVAVDDLRAEQRWPAYTRRALDLGMRSVCGVPLNAWGHTIGVLNIYRSAPSRWTPEETDAGEMLGALGAAYILSTSRLVTQNELVEQLQSALDSRAVIDQAKGILMAKEGVDAATAFKSLRKFSMDRNRKLRDIAQDIVAHTTDVATDIDD